MARRTTIRARPWRLLAALLILHLVIILGVGYGWMQNAAETGHVAGPHAKLSNRILYFLYYPSYWGSERIVLHLLDMQSPGPADTFVRWLGVKKITDIYLHLYWPLLLLFGSIQWLLIGSAAIWLSGRCGSACWLGG